MIGVATKEVAVNTQEHEGDICVRSNGDLAKGWQKCVLLDFCDLVMGQSPPSATYNTQNKGLPFYQGKAEFGLLYPTPEKSCSAPNKIAEQGDILLSVRAPVGPTNLAPHKCCIGRGLSAIRPLGNIEKKFVLFLFRSLEHDLSKEGAGTTFKAITKDFLVNLQVNLPPFNEQQRIVSKLEELLSELDKGIESFETAREQLIVYRQAVLKHAFEGKLTEEWRKKHADELEPAEILLEKIRAERAQRYRQQLDDWKRATKGWEAGGKKSKKPSKPGKPKDLPPLTEEELSELTELPEGWGWIRLGTVIDEPKYGTSKKCSYESSGIGVLRIPNIVGGSINAEDLKYSVFDDDEKALYSLEEGDLLVIRSNGSVSIVGQTALVKGSDTEYLYAGYLIRIRSNKNVLDSKYLNFLFTAHMLRSQIENKAKSTSGVNNINSGELQSLINPVCSVIEQQEIIKQIESRLSVVEKLKQEIEDGLKQSEALRQSLLKKAFEGRLVPQDPNDEPASILLERIKRETAKLKKKARKEKTVAV